MTSTTGSGKSISVTQAWSAVAAFPRWLTAPTVLAEWTVEPRWHLALKHVRMLLVLAAYSLAWYWLGGHSALGGTPANAAVASVGLAPNAAHATAAQAGSPQTAAATPTDNLTAEDAEGLRIDNFRIGAVSGAANRLRYELALSNKGRKLVGKLQFVVLGEQDGDIRELPVESAAAGDSKPRIEVARSLKTKGYLDLPEGYIVHKVVVQVVEGDSPRVTQSAPMWPT